jgi:hypothetical protein
MTQPQTFTAELAGDEGQHGEIVQEAAGTEGGAAAGPGLDAGDRAIAHSAGQTDMASALDAEGSAHNLPSASADIAFTALLAEDLSGSLGDYAGSLFAAPQDYDGHVALALDAGILPNIDAALDLLTSSHHLFDVPALDLGAVADDASHT